jgi:prepilin-type N-terminal cleavage/methylation domain-containing protein
MTPGVSSRRQSGFSLIELAIVFLVLAIIAAIAGASGVAGLSVSIAKWLVILFVALALLTFLF